MNLSSEMGPVKQNSIHLSISVNKITIIMLAPQHSTRYEEVFVPNALRWLTVSDMSATFMQDATSGLFCKVPTVLQRFDVTI